MAQPPPPNLLTDLPDGALARILGLLPARDLAAAQAASSRLRAAAASPPLWRALLRRDFGLPLAAPARRDEAVVGSSGGGAEVAAAAAEFDALGAYATLAAAVGPPDDDDAKAKRRRRRPHHHQPNNLHALRFSAAYCDGGVDRDNHDDYTFDHALCPNRWAPFCSDSAVDVSIVGLLSDDHAPTTTTTRPGGINANDAVVEAHRARLIERCRLAACQMFMRRVDFAALGLVVQPQQGQGQEGEAGATAATTTTTTAPEAAAAATATTTTTTTGNGQTNGSSNPTNPLSCNAATGHGPLRSTPARARRAALAAAEATLAAWPTGTLRRLFFDLWGDLQQGEAMHGGAGTVPLDPAYTGPGRWGRLLLLEAEAQGGSEGGAEATNPDPFRGAAPTARARAECAELAHQILFNDRLLPVAPEPVIVPRQQQQEEQQPQLEPPPQWGQGLSSPPPPQSAAAPAPAPAPSPQFAAYCLAKARRTHRLVDLVTHLRHFGGPSSTAPNRPPPFGRRAITACVREVVVSRSGELTCPVAAGVVMLGQVSGRRRTPVVGPGRVPAPEKLYERLTAGCADGSVPDGFGELMAQRVAEAEARAAEERLAAAGGGDDATTPSRPPLPALLTASDVLRASEEGVLPPVLAHHVVDGGEAEWIEFSPPACGDDEEETEGDNNADNNRRRQYHSPLPLVLWWRFAARDELPPGAADGWDPGEGALVSEMAVEAAVATMIEATAAGATATATTTTALGAPSANAAAIASLFFSGGGAGAAGGNDGDNAAAAAEMLALAAAGGIAAGGGGWLDEDDEDEDEELATAAEEQEEEFFDEAEEADAPLTDSDGLPVGIGAAAAAGAGAGVVVAAEEDDQGEPDDEVPWDAHGEADLPSGEGGGAGGGGAAGPTPPTTTQPQLMTPQMAAVLALVGSTLAGRGPPREGLRRRELLPHVQTHEGKTVLEWPSLEAASAAAAARRGGGARVGGGFWGGLYSGLYGEGGEAAAPSDESSEDEDDDDAGPSERPHHHHRTDLLPSAFDHAAAATTLRGRGAASPSASPPPQQQQQRGLTALPPPPIAPFEAPLVRDTPGERLLGSLFYNKRAAGGQQGRSSSAAASSSSSSSVLPPAQPTHTQVRMRLSRPRCGNTLVVRLLQPEDRMAEYHDHHPAPNVDVAFVSVRGVAVRLGGSGEGGAGAGGVGAELRADVEA